MLGNKLKTILVQHSAWLIFLLGILFIVATIWVPVWVAALLYGSISFSAVSYAESKRHAINEKMRELDYIAAKTMAQQEMEAAFYGFPGEDMS